MVFFSIPPTSDMFAVEIYRHVTFHCKIVRIQISSPSVNRCYSFIHFAPKRILWTWHASRTRNRKVTSPSKAIFFKLFLLLFLFEIVHWKFSLWIFIIWHFFVGKWIGMYICIKGTSLFIVRTCPRIRVLICYVILFGFVK